MSSSRSRRRCCRARARWISTGPSRSSDTLEDQIAEQLGYPQQRQSTFQRAADLRYTGQAFELTVPAPNRKLDAAALEELERLFELEHEKTYGHAFRGTYAMETVTLRVTGSVTPEGVQTPVCAPTRAISRRAARSVYFGPRAWRARHAGPLARARSTQAARRAADRRGIRRHHGGAAELRGAARRRRQYRHRSRPGD